MEKRRKIFTTEPKIQAALPLVRDVVTRMALGKNYKKQIYSVVTEARRLGKERGQKKVGFVTVFWAMVRMETNGEFNFNRPED